MRPWPGTFYPSELCSDLELCSVVDQLFDEFSCYIRYKAHHIHYEHFESKSARYDFYDTRMDRIDLDVKGEIEVTKLRTKSIFTLHQRMERASEIYEIGKLVNFQRAFPAGGC